MLYSRSIQTQFITHISTARSSRNQILNSIPILSMPMWLAETIWPWFRTVYGTTRHPFVRNHWINLKVDVNNVHRDLFGVERQLVHKHKFSFYDDVITWKHFPLYWYFVRGNHRSPVDSPAERDAKIWWFHVFFDIRIKCWPNNVVVGDLRRHRAHVTSLRSCDVRVIWLMTLIWRDEHLISVDISTSRWDIKNSFDQYHTSSQRYITSLGLDIKAQVIDVLQFPRLFRNCGIFHVMLCLILMLN